MGGPLKRRHLAGLLGAVAAFSPLMTAAQSAGPKRVGMLIAVGQTPEYLASVAAFEDVLAARGWKKNQNLAIDVRWSAGNPEKMPGAIGEILAAKPDVILAQSEAVVTALKAATTTIPVVFVHVADPVASGLVASLARPEGNLTGITNSTPTLAGKWLQLLKDMAPKTNRVVMIFNPDTAALRGSIFVGPFLKAAQRLAIDAAPAEVGSSSDIEAALGSLANRPGTGFIAIPDAFLASHSAEIVGLATRFKLPAVFPYRYYAAQGGLLSYGVDNQSLFRTSADYVDRFLRGAKPGDLPVQQPEKFQLVVNARTAKALGLEVTPAMLSEANEVIE